MKIAVISRSASTGGAGIVSRRLTEALRDEGADASLITADDYPRRRLLPFVAGRLRLFPRHRDWRIDTGRYGLPLWNHPAVREADAVILNWINQGTLSLEGIGRIAAMGKKIIWTMHDMWPMTGVCHHAMECRGFEGRCESCPLYPRADRIWERKKRLYDRYDITFVAVSNWLASRARCSSLLKDRHVEVIPNPFRPVEVNGARQPSGSVLFAAASLDNWIKGLDTFRRAVEILSRDHSPEIMLMGGVKDRASLEGFALPVRYLGRVEGEEAIASVYSQADVVVNCSAFENLPGTLVEGQAYGAVPVAFDRGGQSDIITHLSTGYLAPWDADPAARASAIAEGIAWALDAPRDIRERMRRNVDTSFSYHSVASRYLSLLR